MWNPWLVSGAESHTGSHRGFEGGSQYHLSQLLAPLLERVVEMAWKPLAAALFSHCPVIVSHHA